MRKHVAGDDGLSNHADVKFLKLYHLGRPIYLWTVNFMLQEPVPTFEMDLAIECDDYRLKACFATDEVAHT